MRKPTRWVIVALALSAWTLTACTSDPATAERPKAAIVEEVAGSQYLQITLTEQAAKRTGIQTVVVSDQTPMTVPYSAIFYDPSGATFVYVSPAPQIFTRHPIKVESIDGDRVILSGGPAPGTTVVTVGVAELYGAELGIGQ